MLSALTVFGEIDRDDQHENMRAISLVSCASKVDPTYANDMSSSATLSDFASGIWKAIATVTSESSWYTYYTVLC